MAAARIGRIRMKAGGAEVRLIRQEMPNRDGEENWAGKLLSGARGAAEHCPKNGPIVGYVMLALYADQSSYFSYRWGDESPMNRAVLPSYVAELMRCDMITEPEAIHVVNRANGYEPT